MSSPNSPVNAIDSIRRTSRPSIVPERFMDLQAIDQSRTRRIRAPRIGGGVIRGPQARVTSGRTVRSAAQNAASVATINNTNKISRETKGNALICPMSFFALVYQGHETQLPASVASSYHSMRSWEDGSTLMHEINANDLLRMYTFIFDKDTLPEIRKLMRTVKGRAEVLKKIYKRFFEFGTVKHATDSTFQYGNDNNVQKTLYKKATEHNLRLCFFNDAITIQHMNDVARLALPPGDGGAPAKNATNRKKNEAYAKSVKPAFYVNGDFDTPLAQSNVGPAVGEYKKYGEANLRALREKWMALPQGGKHALSIKLNRRRQPVG